MASTNNRKIKNPLSKRGETMKTLTDLFRKRKVVNYFSIQFSFCHIKGLLSH